MCIRDLQSNKANNSIALNVLTLLNKNFMNGLF